MINEWATSSVYDKLELSRDRIERLDATEWEVTFATEIYLKKAAILTGWSPPAVERLQEITQKKTLIDSYGEHIVSAGFDYELVQGGKGIGKCPLSTYIECLPGERYFFDDGSFMRETKLDEGWSTAPGFSSLKIYVDPAKAPLESRGALTFSIGGDGQGIPFHFHGDAYNLLLHGRKRWAIYAPHKMTPTGFLNTETFGLWLQLRTRGDNFIQPTWEFVQQAGEVVYVPEGFLHATMCLGEAVGVVHRSILPHPSTSWHHFVQAQKSREPKKSLDYIKMAIEADSSNADLVVERGICHGRLNAIDLMARCMLKALQLNPFHSMAHKNLIMGLKFLGKDPQKAISDAIRAGVQLDGPLIPGTYHLIRTLKDHPELRDIFNISEDEIQRRARIWNEVLWKGTPSVMEPLQKSWCDELGVSL